MKANCKEGFDCNAGKNLPEVITKSKVVPADKGWEFVTKMTMVMRDILYSNPKLAEMGWHEEALGKNAVVGGFQGQRNWTDWLPNADFSKAIMASTFDWNGPKQPTPFATENDTLNGVAMMLGTLVTGAAEMPVTLLRVNIVEGVGPVLQLAEGWTANLPAGF